jgi:hypothetical protein
MHCSTSGRGNVERSREIGEEIVASMIGKSVEEINIPKTGSSSDTWVNVHCQSQKWICEGAETGCYWRAVR